MDAAADFLVRREGDADRRMRNARLSQKVARGGHDDGEDFRFVLEQRFGAEGVLHRFSDRLEVASDAAPVAGEMYLETEITSVASGDGAVGALVFVEYHGRELDSIRCVRVCAVASHPLSRLSAGDVGFAKILRHPEQSRLGHDDGVTDKGDQ